MPKRAWVSLAIVASLLPLGALVGVATGHVPDLRAVLIALGISAVLVAIPQRRAVSYDGRVLTVKAGLNTRRTPRENLDLAGARVVDLDQDKTLRPVLRTGGMGLPGFHAGHFRTRRFQKLFCLLTERRAALALPERHGKLLLLSLERPHQLLDALRGSE